MNIPQRIRDYLREREIQRLSACQREARQAGDKAKERAFDQARMTAIRERSAGQVQRMEVRKGLQASKSINHRGSVMNEYLQDNVGRFVKLEESGSRLIGICPFHAEQTPSFTVDAESKTYHCFGCDAHGHVEDFQSDLAAHNRAASGAH